MKKRKWTLNKKFQESLLPPKKA
jgi:hypothetical protein